MGSAACEKITQTIFLYLFKYRHIHCKKCRHRSHQSYESRKKVPTKSHYRFHQIPLNGRHRSAKRSYKSLKKYQHRSSIKNHRSRTIMNNRHTSIRKVTTDTTKSDHKSLRSTILSTYNLTRGSGTEEEDG